MLGTTHGSGNVFSAVGSFGHGFESIRRDNDAPPAESKVPDRWREFRAGKHCEIDLQERRRSAGNALPVNATKAAVSAMRKGNVTGAQSTGKTAGGSMY